MHVDLLIKKKGSYFETKVPRLIFIRIEVIRKLSNYLVILFLGIVGYLVY